MFLSFSLAPNTGKKSKLSLSLCLVHLPAARPVRGSSGQCRLAIWSQGAVTHRLQFLAEPTQPLWLHPREAGGDAVSGRQSCSEALCLAEPCLGSAVCPGTRAGEEGLVAHGSHRGLDPARRGAACRRGWALLVGVGRPHPAQSFSVRPAPACCCFCPGADCDCPDGAHAAVTTAVLAPRRPWPPTDGATARRLDHDVPQLRSARVPAPGVAGGHLVQALLPGDRKHTGRGRVPRALGLVSCRRRVAARQAGGGIRGLCIRPGDLRGLPARRNTALP